MPPMNFNMNGDSISNFSKEEWEAYTKEMERHAEKYEEFAARFAEEYSEEMERHLEEHEEKMEQWSEEVERQAEEWAEKMEEQQERYEEQMEEYRKHLEKEPNKRMIESKKETNSKDDDRSGSITPEQLQKLQEVILGELIADGFRERKRGFTHMWFKNGNLFINADYVSKDLHDKYAAIFSKYNMATPKKKFIVRRKSFDTTNMTLRGIKSQQSYGPQLIFYN